MYSIIKRTCTTPIFSGLEESPLAGFLIGFFLGPFGVLFSLRNAVDFGLSLVSCMAILGALEMKGAPICWLLCGIWVVARMKWRELREREQDDANDRPVVGGRCAGRGSGLG